MNTKICTKCNEDQPAARFRHGKRICRDCERVASREYMRKRRQEHPELVKEQKRKSYQKHLDENHARSHERYIAERERRLRYAVEYRKKHREELIEWHRQYRKDNTEKRNQKDRDSYRRHRNKRLDVSKQYREKNRIVVRLHNRSRELRLKYRRANFAPQDWDMCLAYWNNSCAICGRQADEFRIIAADHWVPLIAGGSTDKTNIVPLCHGVDGCNNHKHKNMPEIWLVRQLGEEAGKLKLHEVAAYFASISQ